METNVNQERNEGRGRDTKRDKRGAGAAPAFATNLDTDERNPGDELFLVRTRDGGLASVRIASHELHMTADLIPRIALEYVLRRPRR